MSDWKEFQDLVAKVENLLVPKGATVRSPDRIEDLVTGRPREVDASIRTKVGSTELLVTVECRRRHEVEDDTWIEQLSTKREKIGAARTIAVSSKGFSASAQKTARLKGIELRRFRDISDEDVTRRWLEGLSVGLIVTDYSVDWCAWYDENGNEMDPTVLADDLLAALAEDGLNTGLVHTDRESPTAAGLVARAGDLAIPLDGQPVAKLMRLQFQPGEAQVPTKTGNVSVSRIELNVTFRREAKPAESLKLHQYDGPGGTIMEVVEGDVDLDQRRQKVYVFVKRSQSA